MHPLTSSFARRSAFAGALLGLMLACGAPAQEAAAPTAEVAPPPSGFTDLLPNGLEPLPGVVVGGQPTREQFDEAAARGLKTVINLRAPGESDIGRADVEARGMTYVELPIAGTTDLNAENAAALDAVLAAAERPVMVHCGSGNRVGALFALRAHYLEGAPADEALAFGKEAGLTRLEDAVREVLSSSADAPPPSP